MLGLHGRSSFFARDFSPACDDSIKKMNVPFSFPLVLIGPDAKDAIPALRETQKDSDRAVSRAANIAIQRIMGRGKK